jgi:periplasmic divalent cation tolerance protein
MQARGRITRFDREYNYQSEMKSTSGNSAVIILTTISASADAAAFARALVSERLAACVNLLPPMTSIYRWNEAIEEGLEQQVVIKTTGERVAAIETRFRELHPYELPEFLIVNASASEPYLAWIGASVAAT